MYIKKSLILSLFLCLIVSSVYASNIDRTVYGIFTETYNGAHIGNFNYADAMNLDKWSNDGSVSSVTSEDGVLEGNIFTRFSIDKSSGWEVFAYRPVSSGGSTDPRNMSGFYGGSLKFLVRITSANSAFLTAKVGVQLSSSKHLTKTLSDLGAKADGTWHEITIPLSSSFGISSASDLSAVIGLFTFQPMTLSVGKYMDIDNIRWVRSAAGSFSADLKNISNNSSATNITWNASVFRSGWKVANQYINFDLDLDVLLNWSIRIYTNNGSSDKAGLVATKNGKTYFVPMCWRVDKKVIPYDDGYDAQGHQLKATFNIAEQIYQVGDKYKGRLYDNGVANPNPEYNPWFYFVDSVDKDKVVPAENIDNVDYTTVWSQKGFHAAPGAYWGMSDISANGGTIAPKLYFGAGFDNAAGGLRYEGNIVVALEYE